MPVDFCQNAGQVPGREVRSRRFSGLGPLHEAPAVLLEVLPIPMGQDCLHHGFHWFRSLGNLGLETDDHFLDFTALNLALKGYLQTDGLGGLSMGLILQGLGDDLVQNRNGGLGQSLFHRLVHLTPQAVSGTRCSRACCY